MLLGETYLEYKNSVPALRPVKAFKDIQKSEIVRYPFKNLVIQRRRYPGSSLYWSPGFAS